MPAYQPVRGMQDMLPEDYRRFRHVVDTARAVAGRYGFEHADTPIMEVTDVFARSMGETSDVVSKEMYSFEDRGGENVTLRPEGTAGMVRAFISNGLQNQVPWKVFYAGPMFRYERPQKGRYRQFHQIGVELIGVETPVADIEVIATGAHILSALGLGDKITLELNTLGDLESRATYREALVAYFTGHADKLSEDSRVRLQRNPLRILDSKDEGDKALVVNAPRFDDYLNEYSLSFFARVREGLEAIGVPYVRNQTLVRGLDYYTHTTFEFTTTALGAQGTVLAGGRYDGLVEQLGGPRLPGIGWGSGIERLMMLADQAPAAPRPVALIPLGEAAERKGLVLAEQLRRAGLYVEMGYSGNLKRRLQRADKQNATHAVILGEDELAKGVVTVRDLTSGEQQEVAFDQLAPRLTA
ncbi:histidine--tRNA ligase [Radicibacter daui]|uniref:histidine--tRNA ligase n=1 Tax=Radicibacter daui TaxID=3064829 RepID=UPI004046DD3E